MFKKKKTNIPSRRIARNNARPDNNMSSVTFRRNRTLTGTTSNHFDSLNIKKDLESPRAAVHHLSRKRRKVSSILLIVTLIVAILVLIILNFTASVSISTSGVDISKNIDSSIYQASIKEYLEVNPMSRLRFLLDESAITDYVSSKLPEVLNVKQGNSTFPGETNFVITMRKPVAGWQTDGEQHYVDSNGIPFERNYFSNPDVQIVDDSGASLQTNAAIASKKFLSFVGRVVSLSKNSGYTVTKASLPAGTTRELEIQLKEVSYYVRLSIDRPAGEQVEDMARAIQYFTTHGKTINYVDIRVSGKAFYK
ncbi:MAG: hypothetical protein PWQ10_147 [Patescibacteria group bacterium]|nr:hypothetical protein [Patescibacteria group bacterium]